MSLIQKRGAGPATTASRGGSTMRFKYQARSAEEVKSRANRSIGSRDSYLASEVDFFTPKPGDNTVRILPPTWEGAKHYGLDLHIHYGIGPDKAAYLCLDKMRGDKCPICEERADASALGDEGAEMAKQLRPRQRVLAWVIDRSQEAKGPLAWSMPAGLDKDIVNCSIDKSTGEILAIDDPTAAGYDISFKREGTDERTKYVGIQVARKPSPVSDNAKTADSWLEYVANHPLDSLLTYHEYDAVKAAYAGTTAEVPREAAAGGATGAAAPRVPKRGAAAAPAQAPQQPAHAPDDTGEEKPSWEEIHAMSEGDIEGLLTAFAVDTSDCNVAEGPNALADLADYACGKLEIAAPAPAPAAAGKGSWKDRLAKLKK